MKFFLFVLILIGLFLIFFFSPDIQYSEFQRCEGNAKITGQFIKIFYSKNQNKIGILKSGNNTFMAVINDFEISKNLDYLIYSKLSKFQNQCWLFPDKVVKID